MCTAPFFIFTVVKSWHPLNEFAAISFTVFGVVIAFNDIHPSNAPRYVLYCECFPIVSNPSFNVTVSNKVQL